MENGVELYRGKSMINGKPIVVILTGLQRATKNKKNGEMLQVWILYRTANPIAAVQNGKDEAICGDCPLRRKGCYVRTEQAPNMVWEAWKRGSYARRVSSEHKRKLRNSAIRIGAYGDPAAVPFKIWRNLTNLSIKWTGYTHQWRKCSKHYAKLFMASVESEADARAAQEKGYRTFRIVPPGGEKKKGEIMCPAPRIQCVDCGACNGGKPPKASVVIEAHGGVAKMKHMLKILK